MVIVDVGEAERRLFELVEQVAHGEGIVICKDGQPIADLVPHMFDGDDDLATP